MLTVDELKGVGSACRQYCLVILPVKSGAQHGAHMGFVIDDQNPCRCPHSLLPRSLQAVCLSLLPRNAPQGLHFTPIHGTFVHPAINLFRKKGPFVRLSLLLETMQSK